MNDKADHRGKAIVRDSETRELDPVPSGPRSLRGDAVWWLSALLDLSIQLQQDALPAELAEQFIEKLSQLLPRHAVGICLVEPATGKSTTRLRLPLGDAVEPGRDPTRLFPDFAQERIVTLGGSALSSTLHIASNDATPIDGMLQLGERAAEVFRAALERSRSYRAAVSEQDVRRLQARVIQAEKLASLGQIVAGLVHELNNPLTSIVAYSDYLMKKNAQRQADGQDVSNDLERLRRIGEAAERILKFSRELVAYARPSADVPGPVVLDQVIDKALVFCEHEFQSTAVTIERDFESPLPPVRGIAGQLTQVFVNLFTNAAHAMSDREGQLRVSMRLGESTDSVVVEVFDNGVGIDPGALEHIFEPFYTTKSDGRGSGLGLTIVRDIVSLHGGSLTAHSVVDEGTVFRVELPFAAVPPDEDPPES